MQNLFYVVGTTGVDFNEETEKVTPTEYPMIV